MQLFEFKTEKPFHFNWGGKFIAPNENWTHIARNLSDFELIVMTEGELYIAADDKQYNNWQNNPIVHNKTTVETADNAVVLPTLAKIPRIDRLIVLLKQLQDCDRKYHNRNLNNYSLTTIICELYSQLYLSTNHIAVKREQMQLYTDIVDYISWRIHENIKVNEIAAYFEYNEKYLTTFFKKVSGTPLKTYILNRKMELAKALLTDSNQPIAQIGYDLGFTDNHNFSSAFKKITGQSPSEYRETYAERMLFHQ